MSWDGDQFHQFGSKIKNLHKEQLGLRGRLDSGSLSEYQRLESQLCQLETQEGVFWKQRTKQHWLQGADTNTKFFHKYAFARKKKNILSRKNYVSLKPKKAFLVHGWRVLQ